MNSSDKRHWLITAFEPFGGRTNNNSKTVMDELVNLSARFEPNPEDALVFHCRVLPVEYDRCATQIFDEIARLQSMGIRLEGVLSLGEGAEEFKLETQANNLDDVPDFADNRGVIRTGRKIYDDLDEDAVIPLRFPFEAFSRIRSSKNPGFFVCNHLCARVGRELAARQESETDAPWFG
ncbi:hypothetical protein EB061_01455, partial [bacterium]|nr:hypothetical protein [bacterium]